MVNREDYYIKPVCRVCGSDNVVAMGSARWDMEKQRWAAELLVQETFCTSCMYEVGIDFVGENVDATCSPL